MSGNLYISGDDEPDIVVAPEGDEPGVAITEETTNVVLAGEETTVRITPEEPAQPPALNVDNSEQTVAIVQDDTDDDSLRVDEGEGPRGPRGFDGMSAYDVAVMNGFVGTEEEWLASLEGPPGPAGTAPQSFHWQQDDPSALWLMPHMLGYVSIPTIFDSGGTEWVGEVVYADENETHVQFPNAFGGDAYFS